MQQTSIPAGGEAGTSPEAAPLLTHERSLAGKVGKGSEAGDILDQQVLMLAGQLVSQLNVLLRTARTHGNVNAALDKPVDAILVILRTLERERAVVLRVQHDFVFLGEAHIRTTVQQALMFASLVDTFRASGIGALSFDHAVGARELRELARAMAAPPTGEHALEELRRRLGEAGVTSIGLLEPRALPLSEQPGEAPKTGGEPATATQATAATATARAGSGGDAASWRQRARSGYARAAAALSALNESARDGGTISFRQAKRVIQRIVDVLLRDPAAVLGLTTLRTHDQYTHNHSVNVALLAMALGNRAGYTKVELADLGMAALLHDIGKCAISLEVLNKPGGFTDEEWQIMRTHPSDGVVTLTRLRGVLNVPTRMASAAFEHHMGDDFEGYPRLVVPWRQSLATKVVAIADVYDAMTSARVYRREPLAPTEVLRYMLERAGTRFDPVLMKLFVNCVGLVPVGSMVLLDTGELAVVTAPAPDRELPERPPVRIIARADGQRVDDGPELDLRLKDSDGTFLSSIQRIVDSNRHRIDPSMWVAR